MALRRRDRKRTQLAAPDQSDGGRPDVEHEIDSTGHEIVQRLGRAAVGHMLEVDVHHAFEKRSGEMLRRPIAGRPIVDFSRIGFRMGDEFSHAPPWARLRDDHDQRKAS